ncbi:MAG: hypothetical protein IJS60_07465 [Abditibacteriota bacterium]|nr:hypothetical protein [Abditibacteriota bacterium]
MKLTPIIRYYKKNTTVKIKDISALDDIKWKTDLSSDNNDYTFSFVPKQDIKEDGSVGIKIDFEAWSVDNYVLMPAAVYNGNRFKTFKMDYPPLIMVKEAYDVNMPPHQNDVPRLNIDPGNSKIQLLAGDMSTPCIAIFFKDKKESLFVFGPEQVSGFECGYEIEESQDRKSAFLTVMAPGVRSGLKYWGMKMETESKDRGRTFTLGETISLPLGIYIDKCENIEDFMPFLFSTERYIIKGKL